MLGASIDVRPVLGCCLVYSKTLLILREANIINLSRQIGVIQKWSLTCRATTASWGSSGSGAARRACINWIDICQYVICAERWMTIYLTWTLRRTVRRVIAAAHWSFRMSRQIAPVTLDTFGCQILVINRTWTNHLKCKEYKINQDIEPTLGGLKGYVSGILISSLNFPPA